MVEKLSYQTCCLKTMDHLSLKNLRSQELEEIDVLLRLQIRSIDLKNTGEYEWLSPKLPSRCW